MGELERRVIEGEIVPLDGRVGRQERRDLDSIRAAGRVARARQEERLWLAADRVRGGAWLGEEAVSRLAHLHYRICDLARDDAGLELELRDVEQVVGTGMAARIYRYLNGD